MSKLEIIMAQIRAYIAWAKLLKDVNRPYALHVAEARKLCSLYVEVDKLEKTAIYTAVYELTYKDVA